MVMVEVHYLVPSFDVVGESYSCEPFFREHHDCLIIAITLVNAWGM